MPRLASLGHLVAQLLHIISQLEPVLEGYPRVRAALHNLRSCIEAEIDVALLAKRRKKKLQFANQRTWQKRVGKEKLRRKKLERERDLEGQAQMGLRVGLLWYVRCMLADPMQSVQSLASLCTQFSVEESKAIAASSISRVRDAFVEIVKRLVSQRIHKAAQKTAESHFIVVHVHDGADMRVRATLESGISTADCQLSPRLVPNRQRYAKIENHYLEFVLERKKYPFYAELAPLTKKDAPTLATSVIQVFNSVLEAALPLERPSNQQPRIVLHIVVGDGILTNRALLRRVLAHYKRASPWRRAMKYRVVQVPCGAHKANLVCCTAICGHPCSQPGQHSLAATSTRLFKYLIPFYSDDFGANLRKHVVDNLRVRNHGVLPFDERLDAGMRRLYGPGVFPDSLCNALNVNVLQLARASSPSETPEEARGIVFDELFRLTLIAEQKPVITRFWLFAMCICSILRTCLLGLTGVFQVSTRAPQQENIKRLQRVRTFFADVANIQLLKRAALCLRLSTLAVNISSSKSKSDVPILVRLGRQEVQRKTCEELFEIVAAIGFDPDLSTTPAIAQLLLTQLHIFIRFSEYDDYPVAGWKLVKEFNPAGYILQIEAFLEASPATLDTGFFLPLQAEALQQGSHADCMAFMISDQIQALLSDFYMFSPGTSLDVERKHNQDKASEKNSRVMTVARASRNSILKAFHIWRKAQLHSLLARRKVKKKNIKMNARALAIMKNPSLLPRPLGRRFGEVASSAAASSLVHAGDASALDSFLSEHRAELTAEAAQIRAQSKIEDDGFESNVPITNKAWLSWLNSHQEEFQEELRTATSKRRALYNRKLEAISDLEEVSRLVPKASPLPPWASRMLYGRHGHFFYIKWSSGARLAVVSSSISSNCWAAELSPVPCTNGYEFGFDTSACFEKFARLEMYLTRYNFQQEEPSVFSLEMKARPTSFGFG